jgi:iron complex transport system permease protein
MDANAVSVPTLIEPGNTVVRRFWLKNLSSKILLLFLVVNFFLAISIGPAVIDFWIPIKVFTHLFTDNQESSQYIMSIVNNIRFPRAIFAVLIGFALAISGASLQGICRNPLADPGLLGISSGAAAAAVTAIVFMNVLEVPNSIKPFLIPISAFIGAAISAFIINQMAQVQGRVQIVTLLLAGIALNALFAAIIGLMSYLADDQSLRLITYWLMGSLGSANWQSIFFISPIMFLSIWGIYRRKKALNLMLLGEANARFMGIEVEKIKKELLWLNALTVGLAVSASGIIGFVGLVVPHILRITVGSDYRHLLLNSMLLGGSVLLIADLVARNVVAPAEIPIGIVTSMIGAPVFIFLLMKQKKKLSFGI